MEGKEEGLPPWRKNDTLLLAALFVGLCVLGSWVPSPFGGGPLVDLSLELPRGLTAMWSDEPARAAEVVVAEDFADDEKFEELLEDAPALELDEEGEEATSTPAVALSEAEGEEGEDEGSLKESSAASASAVEAPAVIASAKQPVAAERPMPGGAEQAGGEADEGADEEGDTGEVAQGAAPDGEEDGEDEDDAAAVVVQEAAAAEAAEEPVAVAAGGATTPYQKENVKLRKALAPTLKKLGKSDVALELPCLEEGAAGKCKRRALDGFFAQLREVALDRAKAPARLSQFGDSLTSGDGFTGELRRLLQRHFGDGGQGFVPMRPPQPYMGFRGARITFGGDWDVDTILRSGDAGALGLIGARYEAADGASVDIRMLDRRRRFDRLGVLWSAPTGKSSLKLKWPGLEAPVGQDLTGVAGAPQLAWMDVSDGTDDKHRGVNRLELTGFDEGATFYGLVVERSGPGVVVDNLGMLKGKARYLLRNDARHLDAQLDLRGTDLAMFFYGVNVATQGRPGKKRLARYRDRYARVLKTARGSRGRRDCLVLSILTRGQRDDEGIRARPSVGPLAQAQREAAIKAGCGFWNMYEVMGGDKGVEGWFNREPKLLGSDLAHPTSRGYRYLARRFYRALLWSFDDYLQRSERPQLACKPGSDSGCEGS